jgi:hypothetical protein
MRRVSQSTALFVCLCCHHVSIKFNYLFNNLFYWNFNFVWNFLFNDFFNDFFDWNVNDFFNWIRLLLDDRFDVVVVMVMMVMLS